MGLMKASVSSRDSPDSLSARPITMVPKWVITLHDTHHSIVGLGVGANELGSHAPELRFQPPHHRAGRDRADHDLLAPERADRWPEHRVHADTLTGAVLGECRTDALFQTVDVAQEGVRAHPWSERGGDRLRFGHRHRQHDDVGSLDPWSIERLSLLENIDRVSTSPKGLFEEAPHLSAPAHDEHSPGLLRRPSRCTLCLELFVLLLQGVRRFDEHRHDLTYHRSRQAQLGSDVLGAPEHCALPRAVERMLARKALSFPNFRDEPHPLLDEVEERAVDPVELVPDRVEGWLLFHLEDCSTRADRSADPLQWIRNTASRHFAVCLTFPRAPCK